MTIRETPPKAAIHTAEITASKEIHDKDYKQYIPV